MPHELLKDRVAIVTGGGQGLGRGIALARATQGAMVALMGRTQATLDETHAEIVARGGRAITVQGDVREASDIERCVAGTVEQFGGLDILVNNAQTYRHALLMDATDDDMESTWSSGPLATFRFMRAAYPHLRERRGVIVNLGSGTQLMHDGAFYGVYVAAKNAISALSRTAAVEWGGDGIRVLVVMPAAETDGVKAFRARDPERYADMVSRVPLGRFGDSEHDVGRTIAWMVSDEASYMTGCTIMLDGGQMLLR